MQIVVTGGEYRIYTAREEPFFLQIAIDDFIIATGGVNSGALCSTGGNPAQYVNWILKCTQTNAFLMGAKSTNQLVFKAWNNGCDCNCKTATGTGDNYVFRIKVWWSTSGGSTYVNVKFLNALGEDETDTITFVQSAAISYIRVWEELFQSQATKIETNSPLFMDAESDFLAAVLNINDGTVTTTRMTGNTVGNAINQGGTVSIELTNPDWSDIVDIKLTMRTWVRVYDSYGNNILHGIVMEMEFNMHAFKVNLIIYDAIKMLAYYYCNYNPVLYTNTLGYVGMDGALVFVSNANRVAFPSSYQGNYMTIRDENETKTVAQPMDSGIYKYDDPDTVIAVDNEYGALENIRFDNGSRAYDNAGNTSNFYSIVKTTTPYRVRIRFYIDIAVPHSETILSLRFKIAMKTQSGWGDPHPRFYIKKISGTGTGWKEFYDFYSTEPTVDPGIEGGFFGTLTNIINIDYEIPTTIDANFDNWKEYGTLVDEDEQTGFDVYRYRIDFDVGAISACRTWIFYTDLSAEWANKYPCYLAVGLIDSYKSAYEYYLDKTGYGSNYPVSDKWNSKCVFIISPPINSVIDSVWNYSGLLSAGILIDDETFTGYTESEDVSQLSVYEFLVKTAKQVNAIFYYDLGTIYIRKTFTDSGITLTEEDIVSGTDIVKLNGSNLRSYLEIYGYNNLYTSKTLSPEIGVDNQQIISDPSFRSIYQMTNYINNNLDKWQKYTRTMELTIHANRSDKNYQALRLGTYVSVQLGTAGALWDFSGSNKFVVRAIIWSQIGLKLFAKLSLEQNLQG